VSSVWVPSKVEYDRVDVVEGREGAGPVGVVDRGEGAGADHVTGLVDFQDARGVGLHQHGAAEEAVPPVAEAVGAHGVGGAGLHEFLGAVLAARAAGLVVVDTEGAGRAARGKWAWCVRRRVRVLPPYEAVEGRDGVGGVRAAGYDGLGDPVDLLAGDEGAGALHEQDDVHGRAAVRGLVGVHRVQDGSFAGRGVARDVGGAQYDLGAGGAGDLGDRGVVGRYDDVGDVPRRHAFADGAGDQRDTPDRCQVLSGHALGAPAGGDDGQNGLAHEFGCSCRFNSVGAGHSWPQRRITGATRCTPWR